MYEATMEERKELANRIHRLNSLFTLDYLDDLKKAEEEKAAAKRMTEENSDKITVMVMTGDWNAKVTLGCMKDCMDIIKFLADKEKQVLGWQMDAINAMLNRANEEKEYDFSMPTAISDVLGIRYLKKEEKEA